MTSPLLLRLQPLLDGLQKADDFVQELLESCLYDVTQRISSQHGLSKESLDQHARAVMEGMRLRVFRQPPSEVRVCRGRTKARVRCRNKAPPGSEFCRRHTHQRERYEQERAARQQNREYMFQLNAAQAADHTHAWTGQYVRGCAACERNASPDEATSFSGVSLSGENTDVSSGGEADSVRQPE